MTASGVASGVIYEASSLAIMQRSAPSFVLIATFEELA